MATLAKSPLSGVLLWLRTWRGEREPYPIQWISTRAFIRQEGVKRFCFYGLLRMLALCHFIFGEISNDKVFTVTVIVTITVVRWTF